MAETITHYRDPATGQIVSEVVNPDGTSTFYNPDGSVYAGDVNTLTTCDTGVCDDLSDLPATGAVIPGTVQVLGDDCQWHLLPPGTTDSFVTFVDNGDGTATFTSADGASTVAVCTGPCDHTNVTEVDNGDGTFTYTATHPDGSTTSWTVGDDNTTYTLVDNGDGTFTLNGSDGTANTIGLCDLVDDITQTAALPAGALVLSYDPVGDACQLSPLPPGTTDSFVTFVDNGDGTATFTSADGMSTVDTCLTPCPSYTLNDDDTSTIHLVDNDGTVVSSVPLCDLVDDLTQLGAAPAGAVMLTYDPVAGTCALAPAPDSGETYTLVDNNDGTFSLVDSSNTPVSTVPVCDLLDDLPVVACADATHVYGTDGTNCGPVVIDDLMPKHSFASCDAAVETITPAGAPSGPVAHTFAATYLGSSQFGNKVFAPNGSASGIAPGTFPLAIPVPAATSGCVLALHLSWGSSWDTAFSNPQFFEGISASASGGDIANFTGTIVQEGYTESFLGGVPDETIGHTTYLMDAVTGGAGSTVTIDFTSWPDNVSHDGGGVFTYQWTEICDTTDNLLNVSDFDIAGIQTSTVPFTDTSGAAPYTDSSTAWDLGPCPSIVFAAARHVAVDPNNNTNFSNNTDWPTDWWDAAITYDEIYDKNSSNGWFHCQMGWAAAFIDGGEGSWSWGYTTNGGGPPSTDPAIAMGIPLASCSGGSGSGGTEQSTACASTLTNVNCRQDGVPRCVLQASVTLTAEPGETVTVTPVIGGAAIAYGTESFTNYGATTESVTRNISVEITDLASLIAANGGTYPVSGQWEVTNTAGTGSATINASNISCEVIHV